ncbi:hypothetical protein DY000_02008523 [Brassica cretica]|uniref:Gamma-tubulin complex component n=1 Tax=Brassica cretica TaxID=69181 RepID=A0ABQ7CHZ3_BRACR|nr:hypothetical protein DY000_02008523 [Brassica cretica]
MSETEGGGWIFIETAGQHLRTQIEALASVCGLYDVSLSYCGSPWECLITEATVRFHGFYRGSDLLTYLYSQLKVADPAHIAMLKFLFLKACEPYCVFIRSWIFKAELNDPHKEFIMDCASESTSFSWNKPGISPLKKVREQEVGLLPCFLDGFLVPILRAGQQLQVITKLLELCNPACGHRTFADLLPCWTYYSSTSLVDPSPITFSKLHMEVMIQKRKDYYRRLQEKLGDPSKKFELFLGQVADPAHSAMLKFLFLKACEPYCEFIRSWIFKAELNDPHKEFIMDCASESTSFSWNKPGISPLKKVREQEVGLLPCFLDGFLVPILRAGQQLQVITKLLELCNPACGHRTFADLLPCWTYYSSTSLLDPSPITFNKLHIEVMMQKRKDYYRRLQKKLGDPSKKFELFLGQVPGAISLPISCRDALIPSTVAMDLTRDQNGSDSDDQKTEDRWFSEIDVSCSSECSSTRDSSEASDVGLLDSQT